MTATESPFSWGWLLAAAAAFAADLFLHLPVTDLFDALCARLGFTLYDHLLEIAYALLGVAAVVAVAFWRNRSRWLLLATVVLVAITVPVERLLLVASVENIHYPQNALLAFLLGRGGFSAEASWLLATGLGAMDEGHQYLFLHRGRPNYLDWNDIVLNAIGAGFGIIALLLSRAPRGERRLCSTRTAVASAGLSLIAAGVAAPPVLSPFFETTPAGLRYHVLSASEGLLVISILWLGVRQLLHRLQPQPRAVQASAGE
jgi:hypothetical protein